MSRYDELRQAFSEYKDAERKFVQENLAIAVQITDGLREYLGMPNSFESREGDGRIHYKAYLPVYSVDDDGATHDENYLGSAITHLTDGSFRFGFGVILERAEGAFPKHNLIMKVDCKRRDGKVTIRISDEEVTCVFDGEKCPDIGKAHDLILRLLLQWLKHRPGDGHGFSQFGFRMGN